ncbi:MAG: beta-propeller domain-containing protein [Microthrixaceae bacterium]
MKTRQRPRRAITALGLGACVLATLAGCTDDTDWIGQPVSPPSIVELQSGQRLILASLPDCEGDLERMQDQRRSFNEAQSRNTEDYTILEDSASDGAGVAGSPEGPVASTAAPMPAESAREANAGKAADASSDKSAPATEEDIVGTNIQESGVDEADIIKTNGKVIISLRDGILRVTGIGEDPKVLGTLPLDGTQPLDRLGGDAQLYLIGDKVFVIGNSFYAPIPPGTSPGGAERDIASDSGADYSMAPSATRIIQVDISDPSKPAVTKSYSVDGTLISSRAVGETVHAVLSGSSVEVLPMAIDEAGKASTLGDCSNVRYETTGDSAGKPISSDFAPADPSSPTLTVLSFEDLTEPIEPTVIEGTGGTVYASTESLYVASTVWTDNGEITAIHRFELNSETPAEYRASGLVNGSLLNQFSMSEYDSALRVVTTISEQFMTAPGDVTAGDVTAGDVTTGPAATGPAAIEPSAPSVGARVPDDQEMSTQVAPEPGMQTTIPNDTEPANPIAPGEPTPGEPVPNEPLPDDSVSNQPTPQNTALTTLKVSDMKELGKVSGLAPGESVKSSRFIGPMAYVVTFRQTDPLFAIDVSDPTRPKVLGELKIPGFSEYLHPVGDGLLLGVGRDVDPMSNRDMGLKVSLFDVSDPTAPRELDTWSVRDAYSSVSGDHHAFTWDPKRSRAILPVEGPCSTENGRTDNGRTENGQSNDRVMTSYCASARVLQVSENKITQVGEINHSETVSDSSAMPDRAMIVGQRLWSLSWIGLGYSPVDDPSAVTVIRFN